MAVYSSNGLGPRRNTNLQARGNRRSPSTCFLGFPKLTSQGSPRSGFGRPRGVTVTGLESALSPQNSSLLSLFLIFIKTKLTRVLGAGPLKSRLHPGRRVKIENASRTPQRDPVRLGPSWRDRVLANQDWAWPPPVFVHCTRSTTPAGKRDAQLGRPGFSKTAVTTRGISASAQSGRQWAHGTHQLDGVVSAPRTRAAPGTRRT